MRREEGEERGLDVKNYTLLSETIAFGSTHESN